MSPSLRVLLVEDSEHDAFVILRTLDEGACDLSHVRVESAEELQAQLSGTWDLVISDYTLPGFGGTEALEIVRRERPDLPFILVSGTIGEEAAVEAMRAGAHDYLMKDRLSRLPVAVERALAEAAERKTRRDAEERTRTQAALLGAVGQAVVATTPDGTITYWNHGAERIFGWSDREVVGRHVRDVLNTGHAEHEDQAAIQEVAEGVDHLAEWLIQRRDGTWVPVLTQTTAIRDDTGAAQGIVGVSTDLTERKRAEELFRRLLESAPDAMVIVDGCGTIERVNVQAERLFGYERAEIVGKPVSLLLPERLRARHDRHFQDYVSYPKARPMGAELQLLARAKDGTEIPVEISLGPLQDEDGLLVSAAIRDISQRRAADAQLRFQARLLDSVGQAVIATTCDGQITYWNPAAERLYGWTAGEVIGRNVVDITPSHMSRAQAEEIMAGLQRGESWSGEFLVQRRDGRSFPALVTDTPIQDDLGNLIGIIGISQDISERVAGEQAKARLAAIVQSAMDAIVSTDLDGVITTWNQGAEQLFGYTAGEAVGQSIALVVPSEYQDELSSVLTSIKAGRRGEPHETVRVRKDGQGVPVVVSSSPIYDAYGTLIGTSRITRDITERKRAEQELRESEERYRTVVETSADGIATNDLTGAITFANGRLAQMLGVASPRELVGRPALDLIVPDEREFVANQFDAQLEHEVVARVRCNLLRPDGTHLPVEVSAQNLRDAHGNRIGVTTVHRDISDQLAYEEQLQHLALYDTLTDLPNSTLVRDRLDQGLSSARREDEPLAVLLMDLDHLQEVNDTLGHHAGDLLLLHAGQTVAATLRETDTVGRLGGDEFVAVLSATDATGAVLAAQKLLHAVTQPIAIEGHEIYLSMSIGIALYPHEGADAAILLRRADIAMHDAKRSASGYALYHEETDPHSVERLALIAGLRRAIGEHELVLYYQPKVDLRTGAVLGVEALVRWVHPQRGFLPPGDFISLAEHTGLIRPLTRWVLRRAVDQIKSWNEAGRNIPVAVNLSAWNLQEPELVESVRDLLEQAQIPVGLLGLEITESALMVEPTQALETLRRLHDLGVPLSIDDFGTGYSSLSYLHQFPVDEVKIDRSFVLEMGKDTPGAEAMVRTIAGLGRNLNLTVVAEGIEVEEMEARLRDTGCHAAQGYHYSRPVPASDLVQWLDDRAQRLKRRRTIVVRPENAASDALA